MALFDDKSRYVQFATTYAAVDRRGRAVLALTAAEPPPEDIAGEHLRKDGQRLDHLSSFYLDDATGFWRLCEANDAILPDALAEVDTLQVPTR